MKLLTFRPLDGLNVFTGRSDVMIVHRSSTLP
jgi:hypothetical protein